MNLLTFGAVRNPPSTLPGKVNLCRDDPRFTDLVNRTSEWLTALGSWFDTTREVRLCVTDACVVLPGNIATLLAVRACHGPRRLENEFYTFLPTFHPDAWCNCGITFQYKDQVPSFHALCAPVLLRFFAASASDCGKQITVLGYDKNAIPIRTRFNGVWQDGETVTLAAPFADTVAEFTSWTATVKDLTNGRVTVFSHPAANDTLTPVAVYEAWETAPSYQRWRVHGYRQLAEPGCCPANVVEAQVKLETLAVRNDADFLPVTSRPAMEMAVMGVKAMEDGDLGRADVLLYGNRDNGRLGAVPLLLNELRTRTDDRFAANVAVHGTASFNCLMRGFI